MNLFESRDYKEYLNAYLLHLPKKGHGESVKIAKSIGVNSTMVSQILRGAAHLSHEQALRLTQHLAMTELETEYFMNLVARNRAGDKSTENFYDKQLSRIRELRQDVRDRLKLKSDFEEEHQAVYYSHWFFSAIALICAIPETQTKESISAALNLPLQITAPAIEFLLQIGLLQEKNGRLNLMATHIHVGEDSNHLRRHHLNWRNKAEQSVETGKLSDGLHFTAPVIISAEDSLKIKEELLQAMEKINNIAAPSPCEELHCLTIDWFPVSRPSQNHN